MKTKERIFHSIIFEAIALIMLISFFKLFLKYDLQLVTGVSLLLSLIAMLWNYFFNIGFDHFYGHERINRGFVTRLIHGLLFEIGLLASTIPLLMWILDISFWQAFILDLLVAAFFLVYAIAFNWAYDNLRFKLSNRAVI